VPDEHDAIRPPEAPEIHPDDLALLNAIRNGNQWLRGVTCTLARRGVAFRDEHPERAQMLLDALAAWPAYKAGQLLFDLLELEDFMLDGPPPAIVPTTLDAQALHRMARVVRTIRGHLDGSISRDTTDLNPESWPSPRNTDLPPIEAGFYLYADVVLGILVSARPVIAQYADGNGGLGPDEPGDDSDVAHTSAVVGTPDIVISHVQFKGTVPRTQADEYVEITNRGNAPADISGWLLNADDPRQDFTFPAGVILEPGQAIRVYTNEVHPETGGFTYASKRALWNDKGDVARLFDATGQAISQYGYGNKGRSE
jgi:hypothetical protein